ncbi:splicing factor YJU2-like [Lineus longissimus]|uniref:splicing factor YJU2-like n=1 Tax=Lineus longissimus TaxID=88925 RepID=UPI002B4D1CA2
MSERKVLNKYYPPDFDPSKIPKLKLPRNRQYSIRIMAPFNMRCSTCGEYIYKGKKFNSRKETVEDEDYLGLRIFRFYIKCPRCVAEIAFKTDPQNTDYSLEDGATRNFEAAKTAEKLARQEQQAIEDEEANNPMKVLENRTKASRNEMEMIENLEELRDLNSRHAKLDHEQIIKMHQVYDEQLKLLQEEEDESFIKKVFGKDGAVKRLADSDSDDEESKPSQPKLMKTEKPTDILTLDIKPSQSTSKPTWQKPPGIGSSIKINLKGLVKRKAPSTEASGLDSKSSAVSAPVNELPSNDNAAKDTDNKVCVTSEASDPGKDTSTKSDDFKPAATEDKDSVLKSKPVASGLSLLGNYSDSSDASESD